MNTGTKRLFPIFDLYLLTWTAGVMDALSYVRAGVFTANMTGNTVVLGLAMAGPGRSRVFDCALAIGAFMLGVVIAGVLLVRVPQPDPVDDLKIGTGLEAPFAILFTALWCAFSSQPPEWAKLAMIATAAAALGIQSVAVRRLKISGAVTTFITGTMSTAIVSFLERREPGAVPQGESKTPPLVLAGMFVLNILAALTGGALAVSKTPLAGFDALIPLLAVLLRCFRK